MDDWRCPWLCPGGGFDLPFTVFATFLVLCFVAFVILTFWAARRNP